MSDKNTPPADETAPIAGRPAAPAPAASPADPAPADPAPADAPAAAAYDVPDDPSPADPTAKRSWRERLRRGTASGGGRTFGLGALIAGALAGLIIGGLGGGAIGAVLSGDDHDHGDRFGRVERGFPGDDDGGRGGFGSGPGGSMPVPPTDVPESTPPTEEEDSSAS
jgi:hypothetical protein